MHSKMVIWDLFAKLSNSSFTFKKHHQIVSNENIFCDLVKKYIRQKGEYRTVFATDLTLEWFENNIFGLSLFGNDNYIILDSHKLSASILELLKDSTDRIDTSLILIGNKAIDLGDKVELTEIIQPNFWQMDRLLDFFLHITKVKITVVAREFILDSIEASAGGYYQVAITLHNFYADKLVDLADIQSILEKSKLDKFEFASLLSQKRLSEFFIKLSGLKTDTKTLRSFFVFMQSHLYKIFDPSYTNKKSKLSKYDREILDASKSWQNHELDTVIDDLHQLEMASKKNLESLGHLIQGHALKYHGPSFHK